MPAWQAGPLWVLLSLAGLLVWPLPRGLELTLGRLIGRLALLLDRKRRAIAEENIRRCLPELSDTARAHLLKRKQDGRTGILAHRLVNLAVERVRQVRAVWRNFG